MIGGFAQFRHDVVRIAGLAPDAQDLLEHDAGHGVGGDLLLRRLGERGVDMGGYYFPGCCHLGVSSVRKMSMDENCTQRPSEGSCHNVAVHLADAGKPVRFRAKDGPSDFPRVRRIPLETE